MTHTTLRLTLPFVLLAAIACKKQDEPAATAGYQAGTPGAAGAPAGALPSATAAPAVGSAPAPVSTTPVAPDPALVAAVTPMLTQLAASQTVAGSKALLEQQIMLQPNKCYSVVGAGMPPISELNVQLVAIAVIPGMAPILATDQDVGPSATLGKKPNCYKWALPLPASVKVVVSAAGGQGVAGAQVYEK